MWKNISIELPKLDLEYLSNELFNLDIISVLIEKKNKPHKSNWFDDGINPLKYDHRSHKISVLIDGEKPTNLFIRELMKLLKLKTEPKYNEQKFIDQNWVEHSQQFFGQIEITKTLKILPPWIEIDSSQGRSIIINPGSGFGTGTHPTTQLCLEWIEKNLVKNESLLDFGSGSGILSIAGKKFGSGTTVGVEIDPEAIRNAEGNCKLNNVEISFRRTISESSEKLFDTVISNTLFNTLIHIKEDLKLCTGKRLILAGVLKNQSQKIIDAYSDWIELKICEEKGEWVLLEGIL